MLTIEKTPWLQKLYNSANVYVVGGYIRDFFLNKPNKDIDFLVEGLSIEDIIEILKDFGKTDLVGKSFGVIKFKPHGYTGEDFDIAIPRKDTKIGDSHKDFKIDIDNVSILEDLKRRDFTINSIAVNVKTYEIIDPFNGLSDIKNKIIRATDSSAFSEDPLRILRAIQFASRFGFVIEDNTLQLIKENVDKISHISKERILGEFNKIILKEGSVQLAFDLIRKTNLDKVLFNERIDLSYVSEYSKLDIYSFYFLLGLSGDKNPAEFYKNVLGGENYIYRILSEMTNIFQQISKESSYYEIRYIVFNSLQKSKQLLDVRIFPDVVYEVFNDMRTGKIPMFIKDINFSGNDIIDLGVSGEKVGKLLKSLYKEILKEKLDWKNKNEMLNYINSIL